MSSARVVMKPMRPRVTDADGSVTVSSGPRWLRMVTTPPAGAAGRIGTSSSWACGGSAPGSGCCGTGFCRHEREELQG
jgi:hypothetical protein